jgi:TusA-related sulfurtransferase
MTMVKVKFKLSQMKTGEQLEVLLSGEEPLKNIPRTAKEHGHKIIEIKPDKEPFHKIIIEK